MDLKNYCKWVKEGESTCSLDLDADVFYAEGFWKKLEKIAFFCPLSSLTFAMTFQRQLRIVLQLN